MANGSLFGCTETVDVDQLTADILAQVGPHLQLCTVPPVPDNRADTDLRQAAAGTSVQAARCDHKHPIDRQTMQPDPIVTVAGGGGVLTNNITQRRWSTEEWIEYGMRAQVEMNDNQNQWAYLIIPNIAGFQTPQITIEGTYRSAGNMNDPDNNNQGAMPDAPYMGQEAAHWAYTQRIYIAQYQFRDNPSRVYVMYRVKYIRL